MISIVIPLYNKAYSIKRCVDSVLAQHVPVDDIVVVDDGSTDDSLACLTDGFQEEITRGLIRVVSTKNQGVSAARNLGASLAVHEHICFLDADDEWLPEFTKYMLELIEQCPEASLYSLAHFDKRPNQEMELIPQGVSANFKGYVNDFFVAMAKGKLFLPSKACIKKHALRKVDGFPEGVVTGEDIVVWMLIALKGKVAHWNKPASIIHKYPDASRKQRSGSVPYPFIYFRKHPVVNPPTAFKRYMWTVFYRHFLMSLLHLRYVEAWRRLRAYVLFLVRN